VDLHNLSIGLGYQAQLQLQAVCLDKRQSSLRYHDTMHVSLHSVPPYRRHHKRKTFGCKQWNQPVLEGKCESSTPALSLTNIGLPSSH